MKCAGDQVFKIDVPSLQNIALVAVAVRVWGCPEWEDDVEYRDDEEEFHLNFGEEAIEKLNEMFLPQSFKHQISNLIRPISLQWIKCFDYADTEDFAQCCNLNKLYREGGSSYWTMEGVFDQAKFLKDIINNSKDLNCEEVDFTTLYKSACQYCLEENISDLWLKVSSYCNRRKDYFYCSYGYRGLMVAYWTAVVNDELSDLMRKLAQYDIDNIFDINHSICENMISACVVSSNATGLKYFWPKLTEQEKNANIENWIKLAMKTLAYYYYDSRNEKYFSSEEGEYFHIFDEEYIDSYKFLYQENNSHTHVMYFLLSHLNSQMKLKEMFRTHAGIILHSIYCHWPLQRFFLPTFSVMLMLDSVEERVFVEIMTKIVHLISERRTELLLREMWEVSPLHLKKAFICLQKIHPIALIQLLSVGDDVTLDMILSIASTSEKEMIFSHLLEESSFLKFLCSNKLAIFAIGRLASRTFSSEHNLDYFKRMVTWNYAKGLNYDWMFTVSVLARCNLFDWASKNLNEAKILKQYYVTLMHVYISLIVLGNYEHVNDFLNWCFETKEEISKFKKYFVHEENLEECLSLLRLLSSKGKDGWELFKKFLSYSFDSSDEVKNLCLNLMGYSNEFLFLFQNWCVNFS